MSVAIISRFADSLRAGLTGEVFVPGDRGYDEARQAWSLAADQRPAAVVAAESADDVLSAVRFARERRMRIAPQGTGHGAMSLEPLEGAMLLRTQRMRDVTIDPAAGVGSAEAGAMWHDVTVPAGDHGLAVLAGTSPNVGVTGYTLGGGIGWLARRYGLAANSVVAAQIVTPDGRLVRADADHEEDLFWAIRGGGGSVGVVTSLEMALYPVRQVYAGALFFPVQRSFEVMHAWREWTDEVPDEVTSIARILRFPDIPQVEERFRGQAVAIIEAAYLGGAAAGDKLLRPLRKLGPDLDTFATIPAPALSQLHMDPDQPVAGQGDGAFLADLPTAAICALNSVVGGDANTSLTSIEVRQLGGALARPARCPGAQSAVEARYLMFAGGLAPTPQLVDVVRTDARTLKDVLGPWHARYDYYNFEETPAEARAVLPIASYHRLQKIKASYDPDQAIISAHPVWPAGSLTDGTGRTSSWLASR
jgi:FAD/FMN-containing dehydrogenase